jgi:5-methylcytosine-specific restriction enzyme A
MKRNIFILSLWVIGTCILLYSLPPVVPRIDTPKYTAESVSVSAEPRSPQWPTARVKHLLLHPCCEACGSKNDPNVHHIKPFHLFPELELEEDNLITLCNTHCHIVFGHLCNFKSYNLNVREDAAQYRKEVENRP